MRTETLEYNSLLTDEANDLEQKTFVASEDAGILGFLQYELGTKADLQHIDQNEADSSNINSYCEFSGEDTDTIAYVCKIVTGDNVHTAKKLLQAFTTVHPKALMSESVYHCPISDGGITEKLGKKQDFFTYAREMGFQEVGLAHRTEGELLVYEAKE